jgi:hypothetical protein
MKFKYILFALVAVGLIGLGVGFYLYNKPQKDISKVKAELSVDAKTLYLDFEENETTANEKYLGKVIEVEGEVVHVEILDNGNVIVALLDEMFGVTCTIDSSYAIDDSKQILQISAGQVAAFKGKCDGMLTDVVLTQCVPVKIE